MFFGFLFLVGLTRLVLGLEDIQAPRTSLQRIQDRTPPTVTRITVAPQTVQASGSISTSYISYSGVTANSAVTKIIDGTSTVLPLWYCNPSLSALACKGCPTTTLPSDSPCPTNFNMILLLPAVAAVGVFIPPPEGLPTLTIGSDGYATPEATPQPSDPPTSIDPGETSTSEAPLSAEPYCTIPPLKAADVASSIQVSPPVWIPPTGSPAPTITSDELPILPVTVDNAAPTAWLACGPGGVNPYFPGGFYQFGSSFSRDDGLYAVDTFCREQIKKNLLIGPAGLTVSGMPHKAVPTMSNAYKPPGGSGKIAVMIASDHNNSNIDHQTCPDKWTYSFAEYAQCRQYFGQTIDFCDTTTTLSNSDITWKNGGTFFSHCVFFSVWKSPAGE